MTEMSSAQKVLLITGFLITGSINTMTKKWQFQSCGPSLYSFDAAANRDCDHDGWKHFHKPWTQNIQMFLGESFMIVLFLAMLPGRRRQARDAGQEYQRAPFYIFLAPACCDIIGTGIGGVGMLFISASVWQMMRGSLMIFAAVWSLIFLKKKIPCHEWMAVAISAVGLGLIGMSAILDETPRGMCPSNFPACHKDGDCVISSMATCVSNCDWKFAPDASTPAGDKYNAIHGFDAAGQICHADFQDTSSSNVPLGIALTVFSQAFSAGQMVLEEIFVKGRNAPPEQVVGSEGLWGIMIMLVMLFVMYWIPGKDAGSYENAVDSMHMLFGSDLLLVFVLFYLVSISLFNFFGVTIAGKLSAVHRTINDAMRTMIIWAVEIFVYYCVDKRFGTPWQDHTWLQLIGFGLLVLGNLVKNAIVRVPGLTYPDQEPKPPALTSGSGGVSLIDQPDAQAPLAARRAPGV